MARLDAYIDLLFREQASFLQLETGTGANLHGNNGPRPVLRQPLTTQQIIGAVGELVPIGSTTTTAAQRIGARPDDRAPVAGY